MTTARGLFVSLACVLAGLGLLMVYSASVTSRPSDVEQVYLLRHVTFLLTAVGAAALCAWLPERFWYNVAPYLFTITAVLLILVLIPGVGAEINGARRWLRYGPVSFQPSELAKLALPLFTARLLVQHRERLRHWWHGTVPILFPAAVVVPLVLIQPDLGTAGFLGVSLALLLLVGGWPMRHFILTAAVLGPLASAAVTMQPYQMKRITGYLAAWSDWSEAPYQLQQSLLSLGAGGVWGVGLGRGWQKLSFLPEANTDFVFAVIGEELGLVGTLTVVLLWAGLFALGLKLLKPLDRHGFAFAAGFTLLTQLVLQAALNAAVVTGLVPPKGIPHPLLSYGGSNLLVSIVSLGIVLSLSRSNAEYESPHRS